ncbi:MAG: hypothetical protein K2Q12_04785 [Rickettsiales bacterium]|nr:hypothetical protein [Rickettsiales bacterium]
MSMSDKKPPSNRDVLKGSAAWSWAENHWRNGRPLSLSEMKGELDFAVQLLVVAYKNELIEKRLYADLLTVAASDNFEDTAQAVDDALARIVQDCIREKESPPLDLFKAVQGILSDMAMKKDAPLVPVSTKVAEMMAEFFGDDRANGGHER